MVAGAEVAAGVGLAAAPPQAAATSSATTASPVRTIDASPATRPQMFGRNIKPLQGTIARAAQLVNVGPDKRFAGCPSTASSRNGRRCRVRPRRWPRLDVLSPAQSREYPAKPGEGARG